jgi:raffinose/stachyose/melibiose transport system substrate-binding protein
MDITDELNHDPQGWGTRDDVRKSLQGHDGHDFQIALRLETIGVWYNQELFKKNGITPPAQTPNLQRVEWADFLSWCKTFKSAGLTPFASSGAVAGWMQPTLFENQLIFSKWDGIFGGTLRYADQPEVKQGWDMWRTFYKYGYLPDGYFGLGLDEQRALWVQQKSPMLLDGHWQWREFQDQTKKAGFTYGILPLPSVTPTAPFPYDTPALDAFAASKGTKHPQEATAFLKFLAAPATQAWMTDNWHNISVSPGITYKDPETGMFAQMLNRNLLFKSLGATYGQEVDATYAKQVEPVATDKESVQAAIDAIQQKIDAAKKG